MSPRSEPYRPDAPIVPELAAGAIVVRAGDDRILLLHEKEEARWCFPKGHVDPGESLPAAALREIREETGLADVRLVEELIEVHYRFYQPKKRQNVHKTTVYYLGRTESAEIRTEPIFDRYEWVSLAEARDRVPYDTDRGVLESAARRLPTGRPG